MKRKSFWYLLVPAVLAWTACIDIPTAPVEPTGPPAGWAGDALYTEQTVRVGSTSTATFEITVVWRKDEAPSPAPPEGSARYRVASSRVRVTFRSVDDSSGCTIDGAAEVPLGPNGLLEAEFQPYLEVGPGGEYKGALHAGAMVPYTRVCGGRTFPSQQTLLRMSLYLEGKLTDRRHMSGEMPPETSAGTKVTGSWDFFAQ